MIECVILWNTKMSQCLGKVITIFGPALDQDLLFKIGFLAFTLYRGDGSVKLRAIIPLPFKETITFDAVDVVRIVVEGSNLPNCKCVSLAEAMVPVEDTATCFFVSLNNPNALICCGKVKPVTCSLGLVNIPCGGEECTQPTGTGEDGNCTISVMACPGISQIGDTQFILTRDVHYTTLIMPPGISLNPNGFRIFVTDTFILDGLLEIPPNDGKTGVTLNPDGSIGPCPLGGADTTNPNGTLGGGAKGGDALCSNAKPNDSNNGSNSLVAADTLHFQGANGAGGMGFICFAPGMGGIPIGASGGDAPLTSGTPCDTAIMADNAGRKYTGGAGGGAGAPTGFTSIDGSGGSGGSGGGVIAIFAGSIMGNGTISVRGGNGGSGIASNDFTLNEGGGGGGGLIVIRTNFLQNSITLNVSGGNPGVPNVPPGCPPRAQPGQPGRAIVLPL